MPRSKRERERFICFGPKLSLSLFYVCKEISHEACEVFYSLNKFQLRVVKAPDLLYLSGLSRAISSLRSLHVDFVSNEPGNNSPEGPNCPGALIRQFSFELHKISEHIKPSQLSFALTAQSANLDTAEILLQTIKFLPQLEKCALSIGALRNMQIRSSVQTVGAQMVGRPVAHTSPFPFERLPKELRLSILQETDLVPDTHRFSTNGTIWVERFDFGPLQGWARRNKCCSRCNDCLESCCCIWKPAAFSLTCICRPLPIALFTVNRQISYEAQEVFFSKNKFVLARPLSSIAFIEGLNSRQLALIRHLELYLQSQDTISGYFFEAEGEKIHSQWDHVIEMLRTRLNLEKLELRVDMTRFSDPTDYNEDNIDDLLKNRNLEILMHLKKLGGLHKLLIYLGYFKRSETDAEKAIMGQSYDSAKEGKPPLIW